MKNMEGRDAGIWFRTVAIDVFFLFNGVVVFSSMYFLFRFVKPSDWHENR
jgi:hypothetical protein